MGRSTRFPVAVHILAVLSIEPTRYFSSEFIAKSVGTNSVVVRRILSQLLKAHLVESQAGCVGGARLCVDPRDVTLLAVYDAVEDTCLFRLHDPHPKCPVAMSVKNGLEQTVQRMVDGMRTELHNTPLAQLTRPAAVAYRTSQAATGVKG